MTAIQELLEELNGHSFKELCLNHKYVKDYLESRLKSTYLKKEKQQIIDAAQFVLEQCDTPRKGSLNDFFEEVYDEVIKKI